MSKAPWFPFYTGDFLASPDVQDMEAHEVGAYVLLLARSWQSDMPGYIEDDDYGLRRAARLTADVWAQCKRALLKKWPLAEDMPGFRYNPRLKKEAEKQVELREMKAEAGRKSAERRAALATQRQQPGNTNPTGVEIPATGVGENGNYSQPQSQPQSQEGKPSTSSLRSEVAAPQKKIEEVQAVEPLPESPAPELRTPGGAADVGTPIQPEVKLTKQRGGKKLKPEPGSDNLTDYQLPEWAGDEFRADAAEWLRRRQSRTDVKPLQAAAVQEYFNELAGYTPEFCQGLFSESRKHPNWQGLTFRSTKLDFAQHIQKLQQLQANAARQQQPERGAKPTGNAITGARALSQYLRSVDGSAGTATGGALPLGAATGAHGFQG